ncbi:MAG: CRTAC1 family protein [Acidobacteriota bacterium]
MNRTWSLIAAVFSLAVFALSALPQQADLPVFSEISEAAGIRFKHSYGDYGMDNILEATGAGACIFDYDGDGRLDIYFVNGRWHKGVNDNRGRELRDKLLNALYRNNGDGTFTEVAARAGVAGKGMGFGCSAADFDNDGDLDLYLLNYGPNEFYRNNGDGTFTDISARSGLDNPRWSLSAPWLDYNNDGLLDVYVANYLEYDEGKFRAFYAAAGHPGPLSYHGQPDALYRNNGDGTFTEMTREAGVFNPEGRAMSAMAADLNNDGFLDIYVTNDAGANFYYQNTGKGTFEEKGLELGLAFGENGQGVSSMGPVIGDMDRNGLPDVFIPDMSYSSLLVNEGSYYEDHTTRTGLAVFCGQYTGWGAALMDYDNDGHLDLFVANGHALHEFTEEDLLLRNTGRSPLEFLDVSAKSGGYFHKKFVGRGVAWGDLDNDGDQDIVVCNLNDYARVLRNDGGNRNNWLTLEVRKRNGKTDAIGARVTVQVGPLRQVEDVVAVKGYLSQSDARVHFGLGRSAKADLVEIRWPGGKVQQLRDVKANQFLKVVENGP